jgi:hypothetical protein
VRILFVTVRRQSEAHSVSFGTDVYIVSHIGIWERLAREPWLFEEVEAGAWTGGGATSQTLPSSSIDCTLVRTHSHSVLEKAFMSLTTCVCMISAICAAPFSFVPMQNEKRKAMFSRCRRKASERV